MGMIERLRAGLSGEGGGPRREVVRSPLEARVLTGLRGEDGRANVGAAPIRLHLLWSGDVQGVGFRWSNQGLARERRLAGWAKNLPDGTVEMEVQGQPQTIAAHIEHLHEAYRLTGNRIWLEEACEVAVLPQEKVFDVRF